MGFLVFVPGLAQPGQHNTFHLIDGQQRLCSTSLLLTAIRNVAQSSHQTELENEIHEDYLVHTRKKGDQSYRVLPKDRDRDCFLAIIDRQVPPAGRMADAVQFFERKLEPIAGTETGLRAIFNATCQQLEFMCATLETENAYNIFKSLNSTGVRLGPSDLIRNFVFMHVNPDDHDDFDRTSWTPVELLFSKPDGSLDDDLFSKFFRDFLMSSGRFVEERNTFSVFETRYEATAFSPMELAKELKEHALSYRVIMGTDEDEYPEITRAFKDFNSLDNSAAYPLFLALMSRRRHGEADTKQLRRAIDMLLGFILRRSVCRHNSKSYGPMFVGVIPKLGDDPTGALEEYLLLRGWPDDRQFEAAFAMFSLFDRRYARSVLECFERDLGHREPADLEAAQVEHIMPQTLSQEWRTELGPDAEQIHADWLHRPGNLTLSGYNQPLSNHPFEKKRQMYLQSNITLTRELADYNRWGADEIADRGNRLARKASRIWAGPKERFVPSVTGRSFESVMALADRNGLGEILQVLDDAANVLGLYRRLYSHSVMYSPQLKKGRCFYTVWIDDRVKEPGFAQVALGGAGKWLGENFRRDEHLVGTGVVALNKTSARRMGELLISQKESINAQ